MTNHYANAETIRAANREVKQQEKRIRKIARENRSVAQSIRAWLDRVLAKLGNTDAQERVELQRVRDLYAQALGESRNINAGKSVVGGNLYSHSAVDNAADVEKNVKNKKITASMTDSERAEILREKQFEAPVYQGQADAIIAENSEDLHSRELRIAKKAIIRVAEEFEVYKNYKNSDMKIEVSF